MNDLSLHILDIMQNSVSAGADKIFVTIDENIKKDYLQITIEDNGKGMNAEELSKVADPWFTSRSTRKIGMGIPLFRQTSHESGGFLKIESTKGKGTKVFVNLVHSHIDRPPLGDIANIFILTASSNLEIEFFLKYIFNEKEYNFDTPSVKEALDGMPLNMPSVIKILTNMINSNLDDLKKEDYSLN